MTTRIRAGDLREPITIERSSQTTTGLGEEFMAWATYQTVWASVEQAEGVELARPSQESGGNLVTIFRFRYSEDVDDVTTRDRILWDSEYYDITSVANSGGAHVVIEVRATRRA